MHKVVMFFLWVGIYLTWSVQSRKEATKMLGFIGRKNNPSGGIRTNIKGCMSTTSTVLLGKEDNPVTINEGNYKNELKKVKVRRNISEALHMATYEEMKRDKSVYVLGEDVGLYGGSYKVTKNLAHFFGFARVLDTPICENSFMGLGIGSSINGLRPIVEGMNLSFLILAFNQISNNACMMRYMCDGQFNIPIVIRGPGGVGKQLGPEHSQRIESYLMSVPGIKIVACSTPFNARGLLKSAIRDNNPVLFLEHVLLYNVEEEIPLLPYTLPIDRAQVVRTGNHLTILCYGITRHIALEAAKELANINIQVEVIDLISLKPFDLETIGNSLKKTKKCLILDESAGFGGIGAELYTQVVENFSSFLESRPVRLCTKDVPIAYASRFEDACIVKKEDVVYMATYMHAQRA
ncbi:pyruvate dehydrogenase E1 component subunit beta, putative [Plasmodium knowlesi strain H]|uniref:Pyruvate dehydrogenase E1 component subunit beta, putative n=3 Tax=Plasmodium knowlesi TaxID=5850 RepID=A0A5K1UA33_PLAKH|nr:pyruvate dehydrogenase E1 component subunit beta, putative [Plasmodium knowlesi strain H]OTN65347.1 putative Pyruvate dehydrogenase E1 beta subunit [Plasmodium knowlesi]CAA9989686.1 pyruvate dehydrogenase E1 component subunit beta, putative [Plasmodium knowlesi strain H]SBO22831.1 pyruvate dehydrogenase E1 component subunit beta, putative [Plasmodium knowlesi strain H]SBO23070.1 pyruvate dehydrogenase E1 component subunit beta, putative [Plasmodium knowlesi strain H]VVS79160.1 pyruvate dehy|eukprot:XP_002260410.1 pyruvate dehydrogenase E1 beta subunit,putative [Plasmodium knowlesi strain H]